VPGPHFLLGEEDNGWLYGKNENKINQTIFGEPRLDQVVKAEGFVANSRIYSWWVYALYAYVHLCHEGGETYGQVFR